MRASINIEINAPENCTEQQLREWIDYELGLSKTISADNPLSIYCIGDELFEESSDIKISVLQPEPVIA